MKIPEKIGEMIGDLAEKLEISKIRREAKKCERRAKSERKREPKMLRWADKLETEAKSSANADMAKLDRRIAKIVRQDCMDPGKLWNILKDEYNKVADSLEKKYLEKKRKKA